MKRIIAALLLVVAAACSDVPTTPRFSSGTTATGTIVSADVMVTNSNDAGAGSFREAISQSNGNAAIVPSVHAVVNTIRSEHHTYTGTKTDITQNTRRSMDRRPADQPVG